MGFELRMAPWLQIGGGGVLFFNFTLPHSTGRHVLRPYRQTDSGKVY
jgi:hypothetical protein